MTLQAGARFTRLTVVEDSDWKAVVVKCDCGTVKTVARGKVRSGTTRSCGCLNSELSRQRMLGTRHTFRHGHAKRGGAKSRTYSTWSAMKARCLNPRASNYGRYGAKGVTIYTPWVESFEAFLSDMGARPEGMTIDRIDPTGNYEPGNVRWATAKVQANNHRAANDGRDIFGGNA